MLQAVRTFARTNSFLDVESWFVQDSRELRYRWMTSLLFARKIRIYIFLPLELYKSNLKSKYHPPVDRQSGEQGNGLSIVSRDVNSLRSSLIVKSVCNCLPVAFHSLELPFGGNWIERALPEVYNSPHRGGERANRPWKRKEKHVRSVAKFLFLSLCSFFFLLLLFSLFCTAWFSFAFSFIIDSQPPPSLCSTSSSHRRWTTWNTGK